MNFLQRTPFFRLLLPLIAGIVTFQYLELANWTLWLILVLSIVLFLMSLRFRKTESQYKFRWLFGSGIFLFLMCLAYFLTQQKEEAAQFTHLNEKGIFQVELTESPVEKANSYLCKVSVSQFFEDEQWTDAKGNAIVYIQKDSLSSKLIFGDKLMIEAEFKKPPGAENPEGFNYAKYLKRQGIAATSYLATGTWRKTGYNTAFSVRRISDIVQSNLLEIYRDFKIDGDEFAVLAALTVGYTDALQPDLRASYSATGAMHILSVSGLHVGIVYVVIAFLLGFLDKSTHKKIIKAILIVLFLWAYAFITGLSPSVIRSTLMFTFVAVGASLERKSQIYNTVFMSAFFMLLVNPNFLFDVGFQLSYAAVLSIVFFQRPFAQLLPVQNKLLRWFRDLLTVSVAAQLGTMPFTLYYFHQFPNYFLLTNIVAIPLSTIVIYLAMLLLAVSFVPYISVGVAFLLKWSLWLMNFLIVEIENLPHSLSIIPFDFKQMLFLLMALVGISFYFYTKKFAPLFVGLLSVLVVAGLALQMKYETLNSTKMIVYAGQKHTHVNFLVGRENYAYSADTTELERVAGSYWKMHQINDPVFMDRNGWLNDGFAFFCGKRILILQKELLRKQAMNGPIAVDYLIIGNHLKPKLNQLLEMIEPGKIIVDKSISEWYTESIRRTCEEHNIPFYSVAEKGAYILNFTD